MLFHCRSCSIAVCMPPVLPPELCRNFANPSGGRDRRAGPEAFIRAAVNAGHLAPRRADCPCVHDSSRRQAANVTPARKFLTLSPETGAAHRARRMARSPPPLLVTKSSMAATYEPLHTRSQNSSTVLTEFIVLPHSFHRLSTRSAAPPTRSSALDARQPV